MLRMSTRARRNLLPEVTFNLVLDILASETGFLAVGIEMTCLFRVRSLIPEPGEGLSRTPDCRLYPTTRGPKQFVLSSSRKPRYYIGADYNKELRVYPNRCNTDFRSS